MLYLTSFILEIMHTLALMYKFLLTIPYFMLIIHDTLSWSYYINHHFNSFDIKIYNKLHDWIVLDTLPFVCIYVYIQAFVINIDTLRCVIYCSKLIITSTNGLVINTSKNELQFFYLLPSLKLCTSFNIYLAYYIDYK